MIERVEAEADRRLPIAAVRQAMGLAIFRGVLADEVGTAFLAVLERLNRIGPAADHDGEVAAAYGHLFALLADEAEFYPGEPVGDAWQNHLLDRLISDDNAFSRKATRAGLEQMGPSLVAAVRRDLRSLQALFRLSAEQLSLIAADGLVTWDSFRGLGGLTPDGDRHRLKKLLAAAPDWGDCLGPLAAHFAAAGAGMFAEYRAFRWVHRGGQGRLEGIARPDPIRLDELIGYEKERGPVIRNTEHFLAGFPANNVLLYGDRGTGKSSTVKALLNAYGDRGLRLVEVPKQLLADFPRILGLLRDHRERFILFVDDLSFDEHETAYKDLKAILEGGIEARPENVLLYATSNRRRLVQERWNDRVGPGEEIHRQDTMQEKLSLSDRFGITVTFIAPDQDRFLQIVAALAELRGLPVGPDELRRRAIAWEMGQNGRSGRSARQFVDYLTGELAMAGRS